MYLYSGYNLEVSSVKKTPNKQTKSPSLEDTSSTFQIFISSA